MRKQDILIAYPQTEKKILSDNFIELFRKLKEIQTEPESEVEREKWRDGNEVRPCFKYCRSLKTRKEM